MLRASTGRKVHQNDRQSGECRFITQACIDAGIASVEGDYAAALTTLPDTPAKKQGIAVGQAAAAAILAKRAEDGGTVGPFLNSNCPQDTQAGKYRCTFPFFAFETWEKVTPFVMQDSAQFRPGPPYSVTDKTYTADFNEVKSLGGDGVATPSARTADQTQIALFWWESSPLKWSRIGRTVAGNAGLDLWQNARLSACSIWRWRMAILLWSLPRTIMATGGQSLLLRVPRRMAIQILLLTPTGHRCARLREPRLSIGSLHRGRGGR